jgi:hypothetical protein
MIELPPQYKLKESGDGDLFKKELNSLKLLFIEEFKNWHRSKPYILGGQLYEILNYATNVYTFINVLFGYDKRDYNLNRTEFDIFKDLFPRTIQNNLDKFKLLTDSKILEQVFPDLVTTQELNLPYISVELPNTYKPNQILINYEVKPFSKVNSKLKEIHELALKINTDKNKGTNSSISQYLYLKSITLDDFIVTTTFTDKSYPEYYVIELEYTINKLYYEGNLMDIVLDTADKGFTPGNPYSMESDTLLLFKKLGLKYDFDDWEGF